MADATHEEDMEAVSLGPSCAGAAAPAPAAEPIKVSLRVSAGIASEDLTMKMCVTVQPPPEGERQPSDIICVIDNSGSMGMEATIVGAGGAAESHGLSLLDVAKHGVRTIVHTLTGKDRLGIVSFNHNSRVLLPMTDMTKEGQEKAGEALDNLVSGGGTNIWDGLSAGLELLAPAAKEPGHFGHVMLLTDGESTMRETIIPNLFSYKDQHEGLPGTVNTFGFGYNLDSQLLVGLANAGSGTYSFIPDAGFVGTAFVNMTSNLLATMGKDVYMTLDKPEAGAEIAEPLVHAGWTVEDKGEYLRVGLGNLQYGQSKDVVVPVTLASAEAASELGAGLEFEDINRQKVTVEFTPGKIASAADGEEAALAVEEQWCRCRFVEALQQGMGAAVTKSSSDVTNAQRLVAMAGAAIKASPAAGRKRVQELLEDVLGQSTMALSEDTYFVKWGCHYLPSVMFAHKLQICNNFKDPGVQGYGGPLFERLREEADDIFCKMPAPKPTARCYASYSTPSYGGGGSAPAAPVSMAAYNNPYAGCVDGASHATMADGSVRQVAELAKGDRVAGPGGAAAEVVALACAPCPDGRARLVELQGGLRLTPFHPVLVEGEWRFPIDIGEAEEYPCEAVYSFVLEGAPAMCVGGVPCIALGHGIEDGAAKHPFFSSRRAVEELAALPGYAAGRVELGPGSALRDPETGLVCGFSA